MIEYTKIPNILIYQNNKEELIKLYAIIYNLCDKTNYITYATNKKIANYCNKSEKTIINLLPKLEETKLIKIVNKKSPKRYIRIVKEKEYKESTDKDYQLALEIVNKIKR